MVEFDGAYCVCAALGGILLGLATSVNYVVRGKVTGMSGIVFGIISLNKSELPEKLSIVGGMFMISSFFFLIFGYGQYGGFTPFGPESAIASYTTFPGFVLSGLLVGFGTKLSNGCTSGHGLCGIARLSVRSFVAVGVFLCTAVGISTLAYYQGLGPFVNHPKLSPQIEYNHTASAIAFLIIGLALPAVGFFVAKKAKGDQFITLKQVGDQVIVFVVGVVFAIGLMLSGMSRRENILGFLQINEYWNPGLLFVLGCGLIVNLAVFTVMRRKGTSLNGDKVFDPKNNKIDLQLVGGAFCFGLGWGIGGLCPGPFLVLFSVFTVPIQVLWGVGLVLGMFMAKKLQDRLAPKKEATIGKKQGMDSNRLPMIS